MTSKQEPQENTTQLEELKARVKELEELVYSTENAPIPFIQLSLKKEVEYVNKEGKTLLKAIEGVGLTSTIFSDATEAYISNITTEKEYSIEKEVFECQMSPVINKGLINLYFFDVTERKKSELKLRHSEYRYRKIIETASDIVYRSTPEGYFTYANPIALRKMKCTMEELKQKKFTEFILPDFLQDAELFYLNQFKKRIPNTYYEFPVKANDGNIYWLGQHVQCIVEEGRVLEYMAVARDITDKKKAEEELVVARKKAEESSKAKEQFLANMSHEIRTPLNVIMGMANLLKEASLKDKEEEYLKAILSSSSNLLVIINDLLDLTKVEMGGVELEHIEFSLREIINAVVASNRLKADEKNIQLKAKIDPGICDGLIGDPTRLNQILLNLVNNAVKFTAVGEVSLECELIGEIQDKQRIQFNISDTGIGIAKESQKKIFESFSQEDASVTRKYGGTGLGLAIVKNLVQEFGGEVTVESEKNVGTTFSFSIELPKSNVSFFKGNEEALKEDMNGLKILVAEDNQFNQMLVEAILKKNKIIYTIADNGKHALEKLHDDQFDLILMDMQMPVMGGEEAVKIIREQIDPVIPIIALTANALIGDRDKYLSKGVNEYISKPFTEKELLETISKVLIREKH